jgi:uncharacterized membrane protein
MSREAQPAGRGPARGAATFPTNRLEAFSDGVFAIAVTLLVLELEVPEPGQDLWGELARGWPAYLGYVVSFAFIGGSWLAHSGMTRLLEAADEVLLRLNLLLLLFVSFLPFTTDLMATNLDGSHEDAAVVLFGLNLTLAAGMAYLLIRYAARTPGLPADDVAAEELHRFQRERRFALVLQATATVVGVFLPVVAVLFFLAISLALLVQPLWHTRRTRLGR